MIDFVDARNTMVETQLRPQGVVDNAVLLAMNSVAREEFIPETRRALAYSDDEHDLGETNGRVLPSPMPFARLLQLAEIQPSDVVLDVACGSGYSAAVIASIASAVVGVENSEELVGKADLCLVALEISNAAVLFAPLETGVPSEAPFDVIVVEGMVAHVPDMLFDQLGEGGRLVAYVLPETPHKFEGSSRGVATIFVKSGGTVTSRKVFDGVMPALAAFSHDVEFTL